MVLTIKELVEYVDLYGADQYSNETSFRVINARMRIRSSSHPPLAPPVPRLGVVKEGFRFYETRGVLEAIFEYNVSPQFMIQPKSPYTFTLGVLNYQDDDEWKTRPTFYLELVNANTNTIHVLVASDDVSNNVNIEIAIRHSWVVFQDFTLNHQAFRVEFFPLPEMVGVTCPTLADSIAYFLENL